jgi:hypothetical protein
MNLRFLSMIRIDESAGRVPSEQLMADMGRPIEEPTRTGPLVSTAGLRPTSEGVRLRLRRGGKLSIVDGPFTESKEVIGGYAILEAPSKADAVGLTRRFLKVHGPDWESSARCASLTGRSSAANRSAHSRRACCAHLRTRRFSLSLRPHCTGRGLAMPTWTNAMRSHCRWIIVVAGSLLGRVAIGGLFSLPVFLRPIAQDTG